MDSIVKYGIDFGTTNSSVAITKRAPDGQRITKLLEVDTYDFPMEIIRSVVGYKDGEVFVGSEGLESLAGTEDNPVRQVKLRLIENERDGFSGVVVDGKRKLCSDVISEIFSRLRVAIEREQNGERYNGIVIGVPVETPEAIKSVYHEALAKAGFFHDKDDAAKKTEFVDEPNAVALHYGQKRIHQGKTALVFDFGGGTLDLSILKMGNGAKSASGISPHRVIAKETRSLAGEALTKKLFVRSFFPKYRDEKCDGDPYAFLQVFSDVSKNSRNINGLWMELETSAIGWRFINRLDEIKIELSSKETTVFSFEEAGLKIKPIEITRNDFESAIEEDLNEIRGTVRRLLKSEKCKNEDVKKESIDEVLMAGGSSMIPAVRNLLEEEFGRDKIYYDENELDILTCISQGLALAGYRESVSEPIQLEDITNFSYGVWDAETKKVHTIIPKGTPILDTDFNFRSKSMSIGKYYAEIEHIDPQHNDFRVYIHEDRNRVLELHFKGSVHSGDYKLVFRIDPRKGWLEVRVWDNLHGWVEDLEIEDCRYAISRY
jgi:molecular chaperone DnaK (HSP70)